MPSVRKPVLTAAIILACALGASAGAEEKPAAPTAGHDHAMPVPPASPSGRTPAPADAYAYIGWPINGAVLRSTRFRVWFGLRGMGVAPADTDKPNTGHHHLLIDTPLPPLDEPIPHDKTHLHYGLGQTEAVIELPPGTHTLQLLVGDAHHIPHEPPVMSKKITIVVRP